MSETVAMMLEKDAFSRWLGVSLHHLAAGRCTLHMTVRDDMLNAFAVAHGGIVFSLADSAMAFACNQGERVTVAVDNAITYPAAIHVGDHLVAVAEEEGGSHTLGYYRVTVHCEEKLVALFRGTVYRTRTLHQTAPQHA